MYTQMKVRVDCTKYNQQRQSTISKQYLSLFYYIINISKFQKISMAIPPKLPKFVAMIMLFMILSGTMNTLNDKFQNQQYVVEGGVAKYFYHPYVQNVTIYISIIFAIPIFYVMKKIKSRKNMEDYAELAKTMEDYAELAKTEKKLKFNPIRVTISTFCDTCASLMQGVALNFVPASSYQMMRGGTIATTFLFSILYLKMKMQKHQIAGVCLAILGILLVGTASLVYSTSSSKTQNTGLELAGYILLIVSLFFHGFGHVYEQNLLRTYQLEPIQMLGYAGVIGLIFNVAIVVAASYITCSFGSDACCYDNDGAPFLQSPRMYFQQLGDNTVLLAFCIVEIITIFIVNFCGLSVTKYINAIARAVCDVIRTFLIWIVGIVVTLTVGKNEENYRWQIIQAGAITLQFAGFMLIILGNLAYNQIITLPYFKGKVVESGQYQGTSGSFISPER